MSATSRNQSKRSGYLLLAWLEKRQSFNWLLGAAFLVRLLVVALLWDMPLLSDASAYFGDASKLLNGESYAPFWPPALPTWLALVQEIFGDSPTVARLSMLFWFVLLVFLLRNLFSRFADRYPQINPTLLTNLALLLLSAYPLFVINSVHPLTQLPVACMILLTLNCLLAHKATGDIGPLIIAGFAMGMMALFRPATLLLFAVLPLLFLFARGKIAGSLLPLVIALIPILLWSSKASQMNDRLIIINDSNNKNFFLGNNQYTPEYKTWYLGSHWVGSEEIPEGFEELYREIDAMSPEEQNLKYQELALAEINNNPNGFVKRTFNRFKVFFAFDSYTGSMVAKGMNKGNKIGLPIVALDAFFYAVLFLGSLIFFFLPTYSTEKRIVLYLLAAVALPYFFSFSHPSYHFPMLPIMLVLSCFSFAAFRQSDWHIRRFWSSLSRGKKISFLLILLIFIFIQLEWTYNMLNPTLI